MDKIIMLHHLRNPYGIDETEFRTARLQAADELERLYAIERRAKESFSKIERIVQSFDRLSGRL